MAIDETADASDENLLDLERRRLEAQAQRDRLNVKDDGPEDERLYDLRSDLEEETAKTPAHTVAGIAVKIRLLQESHELDRDAYNADCLRTALESLEHLGGAVPASIAPVAEDPIVGLWRELLAHRAKPEPDDKWLAVETEILQMDALTAEGWAIQAELLAEQVDGRNDGGDERVAKRIAQHLRRMADAERLAGGTA